MRRFLFLIGGLLFSVYGFSQTYMITFQVNMADVTANYTTPEVNGNFNGWCGGCAPMTDSNMDDVWEITIELAAGTYEYKFANDSWAGQENLTPGSPCTLTTGPFTNRLIVVNANATLPVACWGACTDCGFVPESYDVTFQVDMNEAPGSFTTPELNGTFNGWCGACNPMTDSNMDGIWETTMQLEAGSYEYKFSNDNWAGQEELSEGSACTVTNGGFTNRSLMVASDVTLDPVCWGSCLACGVLVATYNVTFSVNMNDYVGNFTTPEVNGNFNGWCGSCAPMSDVNADGIWELSVELDEGTYQYKYSYDGWAGQENLMSGMPCTVSQDGFTNRSLTLTSDLVLPVVCWESCSNCGFVFLEQMDLPVTFDEDGIDYGVIGFGGAEVSTIEADPTDATNTVVKVIKSATAQTWAGTTVTNASEDAFDTAIPFTAENTFMSVRVWSPDAGIVVRLKVEDRTNPTHSVETDAISTIAGGWETLVFNFANEGTGTAELNLGYTFDMASIFFNYGVTGEIAGVKTYYFDDMMFSTGVQPVSHNVTFVVDMNTYGGTFTTPEVNGTFNGWCGGCAPMSDANADGIWELTVELEEGVYDYKFAFDSWAGQEELAQGMACTITTDGFTNRTLNVTGDVTLPAVCWASCEECGEINDTYSVLFQVDMNEVTEPFTTPEVNGTFNGWCGGCAPMSDDNADGVWELIIELEAGTFEYKFAYDSWTGQETLVPGSFCTLTTGAFTNRLITVASDMTLPIVCWGSCNDCENQQGPFNVTFVVDMSYVTEAYTTPEVNGTFNNWCGGCAPMSDDNADNVWELTISLEVGSYEYKFAYDTWAGQEELTDGSTCTVTIDGFTNRELVVTANEVLPEVCWASCDPCIIGVAESNGQIEMSLYPNPAQDQLQVELDNIFNEVLNLRITNAQGSVVYSENLGSVSRFTLDTSTFSDGLYFIHLHSNGINFDRPFVVRN